MRQHKCQKTLGLQNKSLNYLKHIGNPTAMTLCGIYKASIRLKVGSTCFELVPLETSS